MNTPDITHKGQVLAITNRLVEQFRQEHNSKPDGILLRNLRADFNSIMPEAYHGKRMLWLNQVWEKALNGDLALGFPGVPLDARLDATERKDELMPIIRRFAKWQRDEHNVTVGRLIKERHLAELECQDDEVRHGRPTIADFIANGLPSKNPNINPSTNGAYLQVLIKNNPNMTKEEREVVEDAKEEVEQYMYADDYWDAQLNLDDYRLTIRMQEPIDPEEDFTTWTNVGAYKVVTPDKITITNMPRSIDAYMYKSFGSGHFSDFEHLHSFKLTSTPDNGAGGFWALSNLVDDTLALFGDDVITLYTSVDSGVNKVRLRQYTAGSLIGNSVFSGAVDNTQYWDKASRSGTSVQDLIYDDVDLTSLVIILSFTGDTTTLRHALAAMSYNSGDPNLISFEVSAFDFQEEAAGSPWYYQAQQQREG